MERFWWTLKYEDIYLKRYESIRELKVGLFQYIRYYNESRLHQALGYQTPRQAYDTRVEKPFKSLTTLEQLSNTQNDDEVIVLDPCVA